MAEQDDRIKCRYCGSNNFANTPTCWQCNRPLAVSRTPIAQQAPVQMSASPSDFVQPSFTPLTYVDTRAADNAAIALGLLFPIFGYPIGLAFIMLDSPRKVQLGKLAILWSTIGLVISLVLSVLLIAPLAALGKQFLPSSSSTHLPSIPDDLNVLIAEIR